MSAGLLLLAACLAPCAALTRLPARPIARTISSRARVPVISSRSVLASETSGEVALSTVNARRLRRRATAVLAATATGFVAQHAFAATEVVQAAEGANAFLQATSLIFLSEIGDKTFFIASILAARASRIAAFVGSFGALAVMTVISVIVGQVFHAVPDSVTGGLPIDDYVAIASFVYFGVKSISDALASSDGDKLQEELEDAEKELEEGAVLERTRGKIFAVAAEAFTLTVVAEIGDRSQLATIALSAAQDPFVVAGGACLGHALATGIAVISGSVISKYVNEKSIGLFAGTLFLVFALTTFLAI